MKTFDLLYLSVFFIDAVIWGHISDQVAQAAGEDLTAVKGELQSNQAKRWQAIGMLKHIFSSGKLPWEFKKHAIDFLLHITDGNISQKNNDDNSDLSSYMLSVFATLQVVSVVCVCLCHIVHSLHCDSFKSKISGSYNGHHVYTKFSDEEERF